ncbi:MAG: apolipoprotein N-acyltransferase [bacterium]
MTTRKSRLLWVMFSGALLALAMPPLPLGFLAWFSLIPLLLVLESSESWGEAYFAGLLFGAVFFTGTIHWIAWNTGTDLVFRIASMLGTVLLLSSTFGLFTLLHRRLYVSFGRPAHFLFPIVWVAWEALWHHTEFAFPWPLLALTQAKYLTVLQLASVGGTATVSLWVASVNGVLAAGRSRKLTGLVVFIMILSVWIGGNFRLIRLDTIASQKKIGRIALVQGNVEAALKWELGPEYSLNAYLTQTRDIARQHVDLIVWPETAMPVYVQQSVQWRRYFQALVDSLGVPLITGGRYTEFTTKGRQPYNPAFLIRPGGMGVMERYEKVNLVPFGERVPLQKLIPALGNLNLGQAEFTPGKDASVWTLNGSLGPFKVAPNICFESIFPRHLVKSVQLGAEVQLNLTNDGWYIGTAGTRQHLMLSRISAVETGRAVVRATNTGISAIISPSGRFLMLMPEGVRGAVADDIPAPVNTPFNIWGWKIGDAILILSLLLGALAVAVGWKRRVRGETSP